MGEEPAAIREGLQEARVGALQEREDVRRQNHRAPRRAAGRHRLLGLSNLSGSLKTADTPQKRLVSQSLRIRITKVHSIMRPMPKSSTDGVTTALSLPFLWRIRAYFDRYRFFDSSSSCSAVFSASLMAGSSCVSALRTWWPEGSFDRGAQKKGAVFLNLTLPPARLPGS